MGEYRIIIPNWHPTRLNKLMSANRYQRAKYKSYDADMIAAHARMGIVIPKATRPRLVEILIEITVGREPDGDAYFKSVHDALVKTGLLKDDSNKWVDFTPTVYKRSKFKRTTISLTDLGAI